MLNKNFFKKFILFLFFFSHFTYYNTSILDDNYRFHDDSKFDDNDSNFNDDSMTINNVEFIKELQDIQEDSLILPDEEHIEKTTDTQQNTNNYFIGIILITIGLNFVDYIRFYNNYNKYSIHKVDNNLQYSPLNTSSVNNSEENNNILNNNTENNSEENNNILNNNTENNSEENNNTENNSIRILQHNFINEEENTHNIDPNIITAISYNLIRNFNVSQDNHNQIIPTNFRIEIVDNVARIYISIAKQRKPILTPIKIKDYIAKKLNKSVKRIVKYDVLTAAKCNLDLDSESVKTEDIDYLTLFKNTKKNIKIDHKENFYKNFCWVLLEGEQYFQLINLNKNTKLITGYTCKEKDMNDLLKHKFQKYFKIII